MSDPLRRLLGAAAGGAIGYGAFLLVEAREYRLLALVGTGLALGAGLAAKRRHVLWGVIVAILALVATIVVDWRHSLRRDDSIVDFVSNFNSLSHNSRTTYAVA